MPFAHIFACPFALLHLLPNKTDKLGFFSIFVCLFFFDYQARRNEKSTGGAWILSKILQLKSFSPNTLIFFYKHTSETTLR